MTDKQQISLTEWFAQTDHSQKEEIRKEDVEKRERLKVLKRVIGLPFDEPAQFQAADLAKFSPEFEKFYMKKSDDRCALRLNPLDHTLPKMRIKGEKLSVSYEWFKEQKIDSEKYRVDIMPFAGDYAWSSTFVVNSFGVFGEVIMGSRIQLAWGEYTKNKPIGFSYDFSNLTMSEENKIARKQILKFINRINVHNPKHRESLIFELGSEFIQNYLIGYFEVTESEEFGLWFVDYNRVLGRFYADFVQPKYKENNLGGKSGIISGRTGNPGIVRGSVRIVIPEMIGKVHLKENEILVCETTTPDFVSLMKEALAIVTDKGGVLSHASVIAREFRKPCIVATRDATQRLKTGDMVEVNANIGEIRILD